MCGTYGYKAPEVKNKSYISQKCDIWSIGACFYLMATGYLPHNVKGYKSGEGEVLFVEKDWANVDPELRRLVEKLLKFNPSERWDINEALSSPYLSEHDAGKQHSPQSQQTGTMNQQL